MRKLIDILGYAGVFAVLGGLVYYNLTTDWGLVTQTVVYGGLGLLGLYLVGNLGRLKKVLDRRGFRQAGAAGVSVFLVAGILVLVNFLNYRNHERFDLSEGQLHSLSEQSLKLVRSLETEVEVLGFFEDPARARRFQDLMKEYRFASPRIDYEVVDPQRDPSRAAQYEITRLGEIVVRAGEKNQKVNATEEEEITNALIKVTRREEKVIYFLEGHGEKKLDDSSEQGFQAIKEAVEKQNYRVESINLAVEGEIPKDATVLISAGPESNFFANEVALLEEYLKQGGRFLLMIDPETRFSMNDFLGQYGVQVDDNVVIDNSGLGRLLGMSAAAPLVSSYSMHPITEKLEVTTFFPFARSLEAVDSPLGYESQALFSTSPRSWGETELVEGEAIELNEDKDKVGPLALGVVSTRKMGQDDTTAEEAETVEESQPEEGTETAEEGAPEVGTESEETESEGETSAAEARLLVIGDSDFVSNRFVAGAGGNADLFLNAVSWLADDLELIAIRPKSPTSRQVTLTQQDSKLLFWATVVFLPLMTLFFGITIWYRRR